MPQTTLFGALEPTSSASVPLSTRKPREKTSLIWEHAEIDDMGNAPPAAP